MKLPIASFNVRWLVIWWLGAVLIFVGLPSLPAEELSGTAVIPVTVVSDLPSPMVPIDPEIDFSSAIREAGLRGVLDPNSIEVINRDADRKVPHALSPHFRYSDRGRVQWVVQDPEHSHFEIHFQTAKQRPLVVPAERTPPIGVGDLLRYNTGRPEPIGLSYVSRLVDLTGDGCPDLVGCDAYTTEPIFPEEKIPASWKPFLCYPGIKKGEELLFGEAVRLRYRDTPNGPAKDFQAGYVHGDAADFDGDGLTDIAFAAASKSSDCCKIKDVEDFIHLYLNSGERDAGGMPIFVAAGRVRHPDGWWGPVRAVDLDGDGALDLVVGRIYSHATRLAYFIRNTNPKGWPFQSAEPVQFEPGAYAAFHDVNGDGRLDSVCSVDNQKLKRPICYAQVAWRENLGGNPPKFGPPQVLEDIDEHHRALVGTARTGTLRGILTGSAYQGRAHFYQQETTTDPPQPAFQECELRSPSAPIRMGDQGTPFPCDWDGDGDWDLLVGGGVGRVRVLINTGTNEEPAFDEVRTVLSEGKPIELSMSSVFPGMEEYYHDLGYVHPSYVDWDADGLPDLMLPNISNRIFWYKNVGTREEPRFGPRQQVVCDGFPENSETLRRTAQLLGAETKQWTKRVADPSSPFWWRSRAGFGDFNGDGLTDMITADGQSPETPNGYAARSALFIQYRDTQGHLRLRKDRIITLPDGSPMKNVRGQPAQTIPVDWNGDGLLDLVINHGATGDTAPAVLLNIGTKFEPKFDFPKRLACFGNEMSGIAKHGPYYGVGDMDGDGRPDLLACTENSTYLFFRRTAMDMGARPKLVVGPVRVDVTDEQERRIGNR